MAVLSHPEMATGVSKMVACSKGLDIIACAKYSTGSSAHYSLNTNVSCLPQSSNGANASAFCRKMMMDRHLQPVASVGSFCSFAGLRGHLMLGMKFLPSKRLFSNPRGKDHSKVKCAAASRKATLPSHGFDYYELLGIDSRASSAEVKKAYRWLQKRCHPDIAGEVGHDMALLLNEAYGILSDLSTRIVYDQLRVGWLEDNTFRGQPVWSKWFGHPEEDQAVFVDESQCIGCLNCAMIAGETFAIENQFGRARAVNQWANDEVTLQDAIDACPVDCIRWVERNKLPALEHVMSKMPRMTVGLFQHQAEGIRNKADVFNEADMFLEKRARRMEAEESSQSSDSRSTTAAETIRAKGGRWWRTSTSHQAPADMWRAVQQSQGALIPLEWVVSPEEAAAARASRVKVYIPDELRTLHEAAQRRSGSTAANASGPAKPVVDSDEYWTPSERISCPVNFAEKRQRSSRSARASARPAPVIVKTSAGWGSSTKTGLDRLLESLTASIPVVAAATAAIVVGLTAGDSVAQSATDIQAPLPLEFTTGIAPQVIFAAVVWYAIGAAFTGSLTLLQAFVGGKDRHVE